MIQRYEQHLASIQCFVKKIVKGNVCLLCASKFPFCPTHRGKVSDEIVSTKINRERKIMSKCEGLLWASN